jgi:hypothetical protein
VRRATAPASRATSPRPQVTEDACAFAWLELIARQPERTNVMDCLRVVARREAIRLARYDRRLAPLTPQYTRSILGVSVTGIGGPWFSGRHGY